jgi:23S rRNA (cytosine1962-C5)-methyltransferase
MARIVLKKDRDDSVRRHHPWIFSGAISRLEGTVAPGGTVAVADAAGRHLGFAAYSPSSQIQARMWTFGDQVFDAALLRRRLATAIAGRTRLGLDAPTTACRLVHGESDLLPGLIVDRYAGVLVCQFLTAGTEFWRAEIADALRELLPAATGLYERSDAEVRAKEGLPSRVGLLWGEEPAELVEIEEHGLRLLVDIRGGHKTGFYLDQRENRDALRRWVVTLSAGRQPPDGEVAVLNAFSYTGGFGLAALRGGATRVTQLDASAPALELAGRNAVLNGYALDDIEQDGAVEMIEGNVFSVLRAFRADGRRFDAIVLDPPKFVDARSHIEKAARGYKDINHLACQLLKPGGLLFTFSCSGLLAPELFQKIVADAALDAGRPAQIVERLGAPADHPTLLAFPEASYLKGLVCQMIG